jgi:hypothetical protein
MTSPRKTKSSPKTDNGGFYHRVLDEAEKLDFEIAAGVDGIDDEITLLRVKIKKLIESNPEDLKPVLKATETLAKLVKIRYAINNEDKQGLKEALGNVIREIAVPLGVAVIQRK